MAENDQLNTAAGSRPTSSSNKEDRETRIRLQKERQNEDRQKKLDEIKAHALAAQKYKEQKEQERRQRFEEFKHKEDAKRQQVEERKRAINDAERDRLDAILRRNQEREARIEARKRSDRSSMVFAFGSSVPRMLDPVEAYGTFWGQRRATSTQNIPSTAVPLTRRQSERELDGGSKKRATSAGGLQRTNEDTLRMSSSMYEILGLGNSMQIAPIQNNTSLMTRSSSSHFGASSPQTPAGCASGYVGRRRTDLVPTIPPKEASSLNRRSIACSPGRAYSMSRLDQLAKPRRRSDLAPVSETTTPRPLNHSQQSSVSRSMSHLAVSKLGPQRPLRKSDSSSMHQLNAGAPMPPPRSTRATQLRKQKLLVSANPSVASEASSRPSSALSQQSTSSVASSVVMRPIAAPRRPRPVTIAVTGMQALERLDKNTKPPLPKPKRSSSAKLQDKVKKKSIDSPTTAAAKPLLSPTSGTTPSVNSNVEEKIETIQASASNQVPTTEDTPPSDNKLENKELVPTENLLDLTSFESTAPIVNDLINMNGSDVHAASEYKQPIASTDIISKPVQPPESETSPSERIEDTEHLTGVPETEQINSEFTTSNNTLSADENAIIDMTASMTKSRITTEEEAKAALAERRRLAREEAERLAEMERLRIEEENRLEFERQQREEEQQRLLIEQMKAAEQKRLEEAIKEAQKKEEEERMKREEENKQKLLKEEAERKAREEAERQKAELQERLKHEEKEREARRKRVEAIMLRTRGRNSSTPQQTDERYEETNKMNGSKSDNPENGHKNGKDIETVDNNIIPVETLKNANTVVNVDTLSTDDTLNSNNSWQRNNTQNDLLM